MNRTTRWLVGTFVGGVLGAGTFTFLVPDVVLAASLAFVWAVGIALAVRLHRYTAGPNRYEVGRWSGLGVLVSFLPAYFGLLETDVSAELRLALGLLVIGVGFAGMQVGVAMAVEKGIVSSGDDPAAELA